MSPSNLRICVIGTRGFPDFLGGIETVCKHLYSQIIALDPSIEITILTRLVQNMTHENSPENTENAAVERLRIKTIPTIQAPGLENALSTFLAILYALIVVRPDIIHLHGIGPGFYTSLAKLTGSKVVVTDHAADYERPKWGRFGKWFLKTGERMSVKYAHKMICVSHALKDDLHCRFPNFANNVITIRNGGSLKEGKILPNSMLKDKEYFLYVGRLEATKAIDDLMRAFAKANTSKTLIIVGDALDDYEYWNYLQTFNSSNIIFTGAKYGDELYSLYKNAAALVHPSVMEGFCLVVAEAISVNTPVILSDIPAHQEFKLPDTCFFKMGNIEQLAEKLSMPSFDDCISGEAVSYQQANTWQRNALEHLALYKELCTK